MTITTSINYIECTRSPEAIQSIINENVSLKSENQTLKHELQWLKRQIFGQKSERVIPTSDTQCSLGLDTIAVTPPEVKTQTFSVTRKKSPCKQNPAWQR